MANVDEPAVLVQAVAACSTEGCLNEGVGIAVDVVVVHPRVVCGVCGNDIDLGTL